MMEAKYIKKLLAGAKVEWKRLGEVAEVLRGTRLTKKELSDNNPYPVYHGGLIPLGYYHTFNRKGSKTMVINTGSVGEVVWSDIPFWSSDGTYTIEATNEIHDKFIYYVLKMKESLLKSKKRVSGVPTIDKKIIEELLIPIPPLEVQQEIVRILDRFTELTTELTTELQKELTARKKQYEYYRDKLLTPIEHNGKWLLNGKKVEWKPLGEVCQIFTGGEPPANYIKGVNPTSIYKYPIFGNGAEVYGYTDTYRIDKDAVTISSIGANTGVIYYRKAFFTPIIRLKVVLPIKNNLISKYLYYYLSSINIYCKKSSVPNMNANDVKKIQIPIPPLEEQERIVSILDKFDALTNSITEGLPREIELRQKQYEYYRDMLLNFPKEESKLW